ncbi:NAD(+)/NADH kinase [Candidatus Marsarchaeota archaeon]|jgi:hypothetical protein|nr:NAD(+)/NADH kinase [Candidatus Marsarchaeota archaeon]
MKINLIIDKYHNEKAHSIKRALERMGLEISASEYEMTLFVGGDGTFANKSLEFDDRPVLFLSRHWNKPNGSVSYNSQANIDSKSLSRIAKAITAGNYTIEKQPVLNAVYSGKKYSSLYDFFVERYATKEAMRYEIKVKVGKKSFRTYSISNGFIITTPLGSTGYYSYLDVLNGVQQKRIEYGKIGLAHILPVRIRDFCGSNKVGPEIRRVFSDKAVVRATIERDVGQIMFGTAGNRGIRIGAKKPIDFYIDKKNSLKMVLLDFRH